VYILYPPWSAVTILLHEPHPQSVHTQAWLKYSQQKVCGESVYEWVPWSQHGLFTPIELVAEPTMMLALWHMATQHKRDMSSVQATDYETGSEYNDESTHDNNTNKEG
jgi:hypothetical protein